MLEQRAAVLRVLRELSVSEERLSSALVEVWNKSDLLVERQEQPDPPAAGGSPGSTAAPTPTDGACHSGGPAAEGGARSSGEVASSSSVAAAMAADESYRPTAVVASVTRGAGLNELLQEIDKKVDALGCGSGSSSPAIASKRGSSSSSSAQPRKRQAVEQVWSNDMLLRRL